MANKLSILLATVCAALTVSTAAVAQPTSWHSGPMASTASACKSGYYKNVSGKCVHRPVKAPKAPAGASAKCRDGSYSFSQHASGTCSHHGGVSRRIHYP